MNYLKSICVFLIVLMLSSFNRDNQVINNIISINIENCVEKMRVEKLSQFTDNIRYVPLETGGNSLLSFISHFDISEKLILVSDVSNCLLYNREGKFISKIGNKGRGPGEYQFLGDEIKLANNDKIFIQSLYDLYVYNRDGSFDKKYSNCFRVADKYFLPSWISIGDSLILGHVPNVNGQVEFKALLTNLQGNILQSYKNYILFNRNKSISGLENDAHIYRFKNEIYYKELNNDTLFYLTKQNKLFPKYAFKLGKFKEPITERENFRFDNSRMNYYYLYNVFQSENFLFLDCSLGNNFPAKRVTPMKTSIPTETPILHNTTRALGLYNKKTGDLVFCEPTSTDNALNTSGLINDIDAGARFFPKTQINDSTFVMWVSSKELKDHVASVDFKNTKPKFPEKKKQLEELANKLDEFDNPVLIFVTFKSK